MTECRNYFPRGPLTARGPHVGQPCSVCGLSRVRRVKSERQWWSGLVAGVNDEERYKHPRKEGVRGQHNEILFLPWWGWPICLLSYGTVQFGGYVSAFKEEEEHTASIFSSIKNGNTGVPLPEYTVSWSRRPQSQHEDGYGDVDRGRWSSGNDSECIP